MVSFDFDDENNEFKKEWERLNKIDGQDYNKEDIIYSFEETETPEIIEPNIFFDSVDDNNCKEKLLELLLMYDKLQTCYMKSESDRLEITNNYDNLRLEYNNLITTNKIEKQNTSQVENSSSKNIFSNYKNKDNSEKINLQYLIDNYPNYVHIIKCGDFYQARYHSAELLHKWFGFRLFWDVPFHCQWKRPIVGFGSYSSLDKVLNELKHSNKKYIVISDGKITHKFDEGRDFIDDFKKYPL